MSNYNKNTKPNQIRFVREYPSLSEKLIKANYHINELHTLLSTRSLEEDLDITRTAINHRVKKIKKGNHE